MFVHVPSQFVELLAMNSCGTIGIDDDPQGENYIFLGN